MWESGLNCNCPHFHIIREIQDIVAIESGLKPVVSSKTNYLATFKISDSVNVFMLW